MAKCNTLTGSAVKGLNNLPVKVLATAVP